MPGTDLLYDATRYFHHLPPSVHHLEVRTPIQILLHAHVFQPSPTYNKNEKKKTRHDSATLRGDRSFAFLVRFVLTLRAFGFDFAGPADLLRANRAAVRTAAPSALGPHRRCAGRSFPTGRNRRHRYLAWTAQIGAWTSKMRGWSAGLQKKRGLASRCLPEVQILDRRLRWVRGSSRAGLSVMECVDAHALRQLIDVQDGF